MKKIILLTALAMVAMMASPASAAGVLPETGVLVGTANVGTSFVDACDKSGVATVHGQGLFLPEQAGGPAGKSGVWAFTTDTGSVPRGQGRLNACGTLSAVVLPGLGATGPACGMSEGNGQGTLTGSTVPGVPDVQFTVRWPATVGGTLVITGAVQDHPAKSKNPGTLVAVVQAQGGLACTEGKGGKGTGADVFTVVGDFTIVPAP